MSERFPHLFSPGRLGSVTVKNRIMLAAMDLGYASNGEVTDRLIDFYVERARGGIGVIVVGGFAVSPEGTFGHECLRLDEDRFIAPLRRLTESLRPYGTTLLCQLFHAGRDAHPVAGESVAPSPVTSRLTRTMPRALTRPEIRRIVAEFAAAARRAKDAGCHGVEILTAGGFLPAQFLSPLTNHRADEYGGSLENRLRFSQEIMRQSRKAVGPDFVLQVRHSGDDFLPGGNDHAQNVAIAVALEQAGADAISVQAGWEESSVPTSWMVVPRGAFVYLAEGVKRALKSIPVIACNRINTPELAEEIIAEGKADFVAMARAILADPEFPEKARTGRGDEIIPCIACNQGCIDHVFSQGIATCLTNPAAGYEREFAVTPTPHPKRVTVIGGGPAGLEAARILARRGHSVLLLERDDRLGGQLNLAATVPVKQLEFRGYIDFLERDVKRQGVEVRLGVDATADYVSSEHPDAVVIATGSRPRRLALPGLNSGRAVHAWEVLKGNVAAGEKVAIIGAHGTGCDTALYLAAGKAITPDVAATDPRPVTLMRRSGKVGDDLGKTVRWVVMKELSNAGVEALTGLQYDAITPDGVLIRKDGEQRLIPADTVVLATGMESVRGLFAELKGRLDEVYCIGDAHEVRDALAAVRDAATVARQI